MTKYAVVIIDGASGWPREEWDGKTSLAYACTPVLDSLAQNGIIGMAETVPKGLEPSSSVACTSIIGYHPGENYVGRGAIEGAALGIKLEPNQLAMRLNFCSVNDDGILESYSSGNIPTAQAHLLANEVKAATDDETFHLVKGESFRNILVVTGIDELLEGTFMPAHNIADKLVYPYRPTGPGTDKLLHYMDTVSAILDASEINHQRKALGLHPANTAWAFWPSKAPDSIAPFSELYGKKAALSSGVDLLKGISLLMGLDFLPMKGVTDGYDTDYATQAKGCIDALEKCDVVVCHVESPDAAGHDGNAEEKVRAIEAVDREILSRLVEYGKNHDLRILVMPDHPTPLEIKTHSEEPVPFVLAGTGVLANGGKAFDEIQANSTGLIVDPGCMVMSFLLSDDPQEYLKTLNQ